MIQFIGWTLIHSLWEGGIIALLLALAFSATRHSAASVRYALGMTGLALMVALPVATAARMSTFTGASETGVTTSGGTSGVPSGSPAPQRSAADLGSTTAAVGEPAWSGSIPAARTSMFSNLEPFLHWLVVAWLIGLVLLSIRLIGGVAHTRRIVRDKTSPASDRVLRLVARISEDLGVRRAVRALEGTHLTVPVVIGWLRPVIVLPASLVTGLTPWQLEMLLVHELAHIRRYDFLANMLQTVIETLLFFHPAAWWLSDRIREERENCCDDIAVAASGGDRKGYTAALLALEESRDHELGFAAAATGRGSGTLLRRAMRLMTGGPAHIDLGARWIAGVITILAALFTTGPAMGRAADLSIASRAEVPGLPPVEPDAAPSGVERIANRDTVMSYAGNGSFVERWSWAEQRARSLRSSRYWIGYLVAGDATGGEMYYSDRETPVRAGETLLTGRMRIGDATDLEFSGVPLAPLVGNHAPTSTAIFLQFDKAGGDERLVRVHLGSFMLPVHFGGVPAIWLDSTSDDESVKKLRELAASAQSLEIRRELIAAVGAHRDANTVLPPLIGWLESQGEPEGIRREAAESLGEFSDSRAVAALARAVRNDRNSGVRHAAIEAFEGMRVDAAADTLMAFATSLESSDLRRVAIESLGGRHEPRVVTFLARFARGNSDMNLRMAAVEELGNSKPADRAIDLLEEIIRSDADESVKRTAVETLGEVHDDRAAVALRAIAQASGSVRLRRQAMETYSESVDPASAVAFLRLIIVGDLNGEIGLIALETLSELEDDAGIPVVRELSQWSADTRVRNRARAILSER